MNIDIERGLAVTVGLICCCEKVLHPSPLSTVTVLAQSALNCLAIMRPMTNKDEIAYRVAALGTLQPHIEHGSSRLWIAVSINKKAVSKSVGVATICNVLSLSHDNMRSAFRTGGRPILM